MQRKVLVATVAAAPLLALAFGASAEVSVTTARTTPIATATATSAGGADDVRVTADGSIKLTAAGPLITLDSNNKVVSLGTLSTVGVNDSTGILILSGRTGAVTNSAAISLTEDYIPTDTDSDGDLDGAFAQGSNRYGIRLTGAGAFTGDILAESAGSITIEGNNSASISLESQLIGNFTNSGSITVLGNNTAGIRVAAPVTGKVTVNGGVSATGQNAVGVAIDGDITGAFVVQGGVSATGYRYSSRPSLATDRAKLDADDLLQSGSAVRVTASVSGGILLDAPPVESDSTKTDDDGDGVVDTAEGTAAISVSGGAPALLIGSDTRAITVGAVGTGDNAYGLVVRGLVTAGGVYDGVAATAIQLGGNTGQTTTLDNGARLASTITASAYEANATGVSLKSGANVPTLFNQGSITTFTVSEGTFDARGVAIESGATATTLRNDGAISVSVGGEKGNAYGVIDFSGGLTDIQNNGKIVASVVATDDADDKDDADLLPGNETVTGKGVAIDVTRNTSGVTLVQNGRNDGDDGADGVADADADGVDDADEPSIIGAVKFGSGADTFRVLNGSVIGDIAFGDGADTFVIDGGALVLGELTDSDGRLDVTIGKGSLGISNAATINISSLNIGPTSKILFTADPTAGTSTRLVVAGAANMTTGAELGLRLTSLVTQPTSYTVITASSLNVGSLGQSLLQDAPYLYMATSRSDANNVYLDVRRRTATEIGMTRSQASAYDAVFTALGSAGAGTLASTFLAQTGKDGFLNLYDQMLPDQGEGLFASLQSANQLISAATAVRPDPGERYGPDSVWIQEINSLVRREDGDTLGSDNQAFGFVGGYEAMGDAGGALGLTLAYVNVEEHDTIAQVGEQTTASFVQAGGYWRRSLGGWRMNVGGSAGYGWFQGDRRLIAPDSDGDGVADLILSNTADWGGATLTAFGGVAYEAKMGRYFLRPEGRIDYVWLREGKRTEKGGGTGFDLTVDERTSSNLSGEFGIAFGADYGKDLWYRPEVRVGYRQTLAGEVGDTTARFTGGNPFTLAALNDKQGAVTLGFSIKAGTPMSYLALEGGAEASKKQKRYNLRLAGRAMF